MHAARIIQKIAAYLLVAVSATLFFYHIIVLATAMYVGRDADLEAHWLRSVYQPFLYAILSLAVMLVAQFAVLGKPAEQERYIRAFGTMVFFAVGVVAAVLALVKGLLAIPANPVCQNPAFLCFALCPALAIFLGESLWGFALFLRYHADERREAVKKAETKDQDSRVELTKGE